MIHTDGCTCLYHLRRMASSQLCDTWKSRPECSSVYPQTTSVWGYNHLAVATWGSRAAQKHLVQTLPLRSSLWVTPAWAPGRWGKRPPENPSHHLSSHLKTLTSQLRPRASWTRGNPSQLSPAWISDYRIREQNKNSWFKLFNFRGIFNAEIAAEIALF